MRLRRRTTAERIERAFAKLLEKSAREQHWTFDTPDKVIITDWQVDVGLEDGQVQLEARIRAIPKGWNYVR